MRSITLAFLLFAVTLVASKPEQSLLPWPVCVSHNDCRPGSCCVITENRYSYPTCQVQPTEGESCRPSPEREINSIRYYPNDVQLALVDVYVTKCPCNTGTYCNREEGVCRINPSEDNNI